VAHLAVPAVEDLGVDAIEVPHEPRQVGLAGMQHEVVVVTHQAVGQHLRIEALYALGQHGEQGGAVGVVHEDGFAPVAAGEVTW
jgi:hypothetical protein